MMELGIDDGEGDKSNKNNTKKEENEKNAHDLGDEGEKSITIVVLLSIFREWELFCQRHIHETAILLSAIRRI